MSGRFNLRGIWWRHFLPVAGLTALLLTPFIRRFFADHVGRWAYILALSFCLCFCLTPIVRGIALHFGVLDHPGGRKDHRQATPLLGGAAIFIAFCLSVLSNGIFNPAITAILAGAMILFIIGLLDDIREIPAGWKLGGQIAAVSLVMGFGVVLGVLPNALGWVGRAGNGALTVLWIVGITNAMNFFDGMDGMAAGLGAIVSLFLGIVAFQSGQALLGWLAAAMMGSCIGFLPYNLLKSGPATIYLGDAGSTTIGFILSSLAVYGHWAENDPVAALAPPILIFWVLIFDMVHITVDRIVQKKVRSMREWLEYVGHDHLHHRIAAVLGGTRRSVLFIYGMSFCMGISAVVLPNASDLHILLLLAQATVIVVLITILERRGRYLAGTAGRRVDRVSQKNDGRTTNRDGYGSGAGSRITKL